MESFVREASYYLVFYHRQYSWKQHDAVVRAVRNASAEWRGTSEMVSITPNYKTPLYEVGQEQLGFSVFLPVRLVKADYNEGVSKLRSCEDICQYFFKKSRNYQNKS